MGSAGHWKGIAERVEDHLEECGLRGPEGRPWQRREGWRQGSGKD